MLDNYSETVQSVERAITILEALCREPELGITELSREIGLGKSTVHRLISTLKMKGLVEQTPLGKYKLSLKLFEMGSMVVNRLGLRKEAGPYLEYLAKISNETVNLATLDQDSVIYLERIESSEPLRMGLEVGRRFPAYCSGLGKAILANLSKQELNEYLNRPSFKDSLVQYTNKTIIDPHILLTHLHTIKQQGYSFDDEEYIPGIRCLAAPVFNHTGKVVAAISVAGPTLRMTDNKIAELIPCVKEAARKISRQLGYQG